MPTQTVTVAVIGQLLDLTPRRIQQLAANGVIPRAAHGEYDLILTVRAYLQRAREEADLSVSGLSDATLRDLRKRLMTVPAIVAPQLTSPKTTGQIRKIVRDTLNAALDGYPQTGRRPNVRTPHKV